MSESLAKPTFSLTILRSHSNRAPSAKQAKKNPFPPCVTHFKIGNPASASGAHEWKLTASGARVELDCGDLIDDDNDGIRLVTR